MNVFDFAMGMEQKGQMFYKGLAGATGNIGLKRIFTMMVDDEEVLYRQFAEMKRTADKAKLSDAGSLEEGYDPYGKQGSAPNILEGIRDDVDAYRFIISQEKELYRMYEQAAEREADPELKTALLEVASAEHREHDSIRATCDFVNAPNEYLAWGEFSNIGEFHNFGRDED